MVDEIWPSHKDKLEQWELRHMQRHVAYQTMGHHHALAGGVSERPVEDLPSMEMATPPASPRAAAAPDPTPDSGAFIQLAKATWAAAGTSAAKRAIFDTIKAMPVGGARQRQGDRAQNLAQNPRIRGDDGSGRRIGDFLERGMRGAKRPASTQGSHTRAASQTGKAKTAQKGKKQGKKKKTLKAGARKGPPRPPKKLSERIDAAQARKMH